MPSFLAPVQGLAQDMAGPFLRALGGPPSRRVGGRTGRTHIEVRGLHRDGDDEPRRLLEKQLRAVPGVADAVVNVALGRVVVDHDDDVAVTRLLAVVDDLEQAQDLADADTADGGAFHPADGVAVTRQMVALGLDAVGLAAFAVERVLTPLPPASVVVPPVVTVGLSFVDAVPALRGLAERTAGASSTESWFSVGSATVQAIGRGPLGLVADGCYRVLKGREATARGRAWARWDTDCDLSAHRAEVCAPPAARPGTFPGGPIERVGDGAGAAGVAGLGLAAALVPTRTVAVISAAVPKAARWGREAYAAEAGRVLAERECLVLDSGALRRADRVDVVVADPALLRRPEVAVLAAGIGRVIPIDASPALDHVRTWQERGHGVVLVTADAEGAALDAADVAVVLRGEGVAASWYADVVCPDVDAVLAVLAVVAAARAAAWRAAVLALLASGVALPAALLVPLPWHARRASTAVTLGALLSLGVGSWAGGAAASHRS